jgi:hypothetical protein
MKGSPGFVALLVAISDIAVTDRLQPGIAVNWA